jgi:hypothetical protein
MTMYNYRLDSFTHVEHLYNTTKPIRGSKIVPLGDRRRKWERIVKVSPKCYVLLDELHADKYKSYNWYKTEEQQIAEAAVMWTRNADGTDTVQFRNESGDHAHCSRYSFLERCMPMNMDFLVDGGKQYIRYDGKRYYVPKDTDKPVKFSTGRTNSSIEGLLPRAFRHSALWELISEPHLVPVVRTRINKSAKEPYLKGIQEYVHWAWTMTPLLDNKDRTFESARNIRGQVRGYLQSTHASQDKFREVLDNPDHPARTDLVAHFLLSYSDTVRRVGWDDRQRCYVDYSNKSLTEDPKKFRSAFNTWVNTFAGFIEKFNEYRGGE